MKKETLVSYIDKGDVNHNGYIINVTKKDFDNILNNFITIEVKPVNEYTDSVYHQAFLKYITEEDLDKIEEAFENDYKIMKKQEEILKRNPIELIQIPNLSSNYIASFIDQKKREYVLIEVSGNEDKCELVKFDKEPDCPVNMPVEIKGQVINPTYSFWLGYGIYNVAEFKNVLENDIEYTEEETESL